MDAAAFADWLSVDERLRRAIEKKEQPTRNGGKAPASPPPGSPPPSPASPPD